MVTTGTSDHTRSLAFEFVSILPSNAGDRDWQLVADPNGNEYRALGMPLAYTILFAYFPRALQRKERLLGTPDWVWNNKFDFVAKVAPEDIAAWHNSLERGLGAPNPMLEAMLQSALTDRCKLAFHRIPAKVKGLALVVGNPGPNPERLVKAGPYETVPDNAQEIPDNGRVVPVTSPDVPVLHFYKTTMKSLVAFLSKSGKLVEDRTGLTGIYDFALPRLSRDGDPSVDWDVGVLGLRFESIEAQTENIVIDQIERPSPN